MKFAKLILFCLLPSIGFSQGKNAGSPARPKLVVGMVIDQMRWDYIYRYSDRYGDGGFKRLLKDGFSCENTYISYIPTYTACGHSSIYTGSVPAINGIAGNDWIEQQSGKRMYCTQDDDVSTVGSTSDAGKMSPKNMLSSTIGDELKLATNFKAKVIGISIKDRGAILPAGHSADGAYWFDDVSGNWITSTFYRNELPKWVSDFNQKKLAQKYLSKDWETLYPINTYVQSTADNTPYEGRYKGEDAPVFPHRLSQLSKGEGLNLIRATPFGNSLTLDIAKEAIVNEDLGKDNITDLLAVSLSSTDYVGHQFAPNSVEAEDTYLRLDKDLESFLKYLDEKVGKGNYTFFLTADHGAAHNPQFLKDNRFHAGNWDKKPLMEQLDKISENKYKVKGLIRSFTNYQVCFDYDLIQKNNIDLDELKKDCVDALKLLPEVSFVADMGQLQSAAIPALLKEKIINGYNKNRSGEIVVILDPAYFQGGKTGTTHGTWNPYDTHIPMLFMGWGIKSGQTLNRHTSMCDIAPTISALLHIQEPNGNIGQPIEEVLAK